MYSTECPGNNLYHRLPQPPFTATVVPIPDFRPTTEDDPMFVIRVENKPGPATLIRSAGPPVSLTSSRAWRQLVKLSNVADVPLPRAAYDRQLAAAKAAG